LKGKLYIIPTPIGNLKDITLRAIEILKTLDLLLCEDTRTTSKLLNHYDIKVAKKSYHIHNEHNVLPTILKQLKEGQVIGLVSDSGMPSISDPGFLIIRAAIQEEISVECLPGAVAFIPALLQSSLSCQSFIFEGFLPVKKKRSARLKALINESRTLIFYESPHRLLKTLNDFLVVFGSERKVSISRELTKKFEETFRGNLTEAIVHFENKKPKGEFTICLEGKNNKQK